MKMDKLGCVSLSNLVDDEKIVFVFQQKSEISLIQSQYRSPVKFKSWPFTLSIQNIE